MGWFRNRWRRRDIAKIEAPESGAPKTAPQTQPPKAPADPKKRTSHWADWSGTDYSYFDGPSPTDGQVMGTAGFMLEGYDRNYCACHERPDRCGPHRLHGPTKYDRIYSAIRMLAIESGRPDDVSHIMADTCAKRDGASLKPLPALPRFHRERVVSLATSRVRYVHVYGHPIVGYQYSIRIRAEPTVEGSEIFRSPATALKAGTTHASGI